MEQNTSDEFAETSPEQINLQMRSKRAVPSGYLTESLGWGGWQVGLGVVVYEGWVLGVGVARTGAAPRVLSRSRDKPLYT